MQMLYTGHNGQVQVDDQGITISRKGVLGFLTQGLKGDKRIPFDSITAVQFKSAGMLTNGYIQFTISGGNESRGGVLKATSDENTVMFRAGEQGTAFAQLRTLVEGRIADRRRGNAAPSAADEIERFASLRDRGLITTEEYEAKKRVLLGL